MKVIGLTGGIGSGKSTVAGFLKELGAVVIDTDKVGHEVFEPHTPGWRQVVAAFGQEILKDNSEIDRKRLGEIVFADSEALARLNSIVHPLIRETVKAWLEEYRHKGVGVVALEAPLLIDAPLARKTDEPALWDEVDEVWVTVAPESVVLKRLKNKGGLAEPEALARIHSQLPSEERVKHADVVIDTDCRLDELKLRVQELWNKLSLDT